MRIAQIAPLYEPVPPTFYGGTERVVHALTEELVDRGHDVTLFATADSQTRARLVPIVETGTRLGGARDALAAHMAMLDVVYTRASEFDIIHSHVDVLAYPFARNSRTPTVSTLHGRLDRPEHRTVYQRFHDMNLVSISDSQRAPLADLDLNWRATVHNGIRLERYPFQRSPQTPHYLAFIGRFSPEKGPEQAIEIARRAGMPLKIAAKIEPADEDWAREHVFPMLESPDIEFLGEIDDRRKSEVLGGATALLFPINWPEPFGMVMVEAMACGSPVIAFPGGSVTEVIKHGVTGLVCHSVDEAVDAVHRVSELDRTECRSRVEQRFSSRTMCLGYEAVYRGILTERLLMDATPADAVTAEFSSGISDSMIV